MPDDPITPTVETPETPAEPSDVEAELAKVKAALKAANRESAERRKRLEDLEKADTERKTAEMTELERLKAEREAALKEAASAREQSRQMLIRSAFVAEAAKAGAAHPTDVYLLADRSAVDVDEAGNVTGVAEAIKALLDAGRIPLSGKPQAPALDGGAGSGDRSKGGPRLSPLEIELAGKLGLTAEQYTKNKAAIAARQQE